MKQNAAGVLSGILLVCVLLANTVFTLFGNTVSTAFPTASKDQILLPVLVYERILPDTNNSRTVSVTEFENDIRYLQKKGFTTISANQLREYLDGTGDLPEKPVMITFDGGHTGVYEYAYPVLIQYDACAVVNVVGKYTDLYSYRDVSNPESACLSWLQVGELAESGVFEIGNCGYDPEKTANPDRTGREVLVQDVSSMGAHIEEQTGMATSIAVLPTVLQPEDEIWDQAGVRIVFTNEEGVNLLERSPTASSRTVINRFVRSGNEDRREFMRKAGVR